MLSPEIQEMVQGAAHELLLWVGFGTLVGLAGKAIMPGRDPGGAVGTICIGIAGSVLGCGALLLFDSSLKVTPISGWGFLTATFGSLVLLIFYRILSNSYLLEPIDGATNDGQSVPYWRRRRRTRAA